MTPFAEGQEERIREAVKERIEEYISSGRDVAFSLAASTQDNRDHIAQIGKSILCTKWGVGYPGGSFAQAVVDNNLTETFGRADHVNLNCIRFYVSLIYNQQYVS
jgi:hypothetical protein